MPAEPTSERVEDAGQELSRLDLIALACVYSGRVETGPARDIPMDVWTSLYKRKFLANTRDATDEYECSVTPAGDNALKRAAATAIAPPAPSSPSVPGEGELWHNRAADAAGLTALTRALLAQVLDAVHGNAAQTVASALACKVMTDAVRLTALTAENQRLAEANGKLQGVMAKLPTTRDGVPIVPGMRVWSNEFGQPHRDTGLVRAVWREEVSVTGERATHAVRVSVVYSTKFAAAAALASPDTPPPGSSADKRIKLLREADAAGAGEREGGGDAE